MKMNIVFTDCTGTRGSVPFEQKDAYDKWATYCDVMLTGGGAIEDLVTIPGQAEDSHIVMISLTAPLEDGQPFTIATFFLTCEHEVGIDKDKRATSALLKPKEQDLVVPKKPSLIVSKGAVR